MHACSGHAGCTWKATFGIMFIEFKHFKLLIYMKHEFFLVKRFLIGVSILCFQLAISLKNLFCKEFRTDVHATPLKVLTSILVCCALFLSCTSYRIVDINQNPNYLLPPYLTKSKMKKLLSGKKDLHIKVTNALTKKSGNATGNSAAVIINQPDLKEIEIYDSKDDAFCVQFRIYTKTGVFIGNKVPLFIKLDYTTLETSGSFDAKKIASFSDKLKTVLDNLDEGKVYTKSGTSQKLTLIAGQKHRSYQLLEEIFQQLPIPVKETLAKYSYRTDKSLTYSDLLPGMYLRAEKGTIKGDVITWEDAINYQVTRTESEQVTLSPYTASFQELDIGPATNIASVGIVIDASTTNKASKYMGLITPANFRSSAVNAHPPCVINSTSKLCNQTITLGNDFSSYSTTILPIYRGCDNPLSISIVNNCSNSTCWQFNITPTNKIGLTPFIKITDPYKREKIIELQTTKEGYESSFGADLIIRRPYKNRHAVIRHATKELKLHLFDLLEFK